jgi:hypothetical protein
MASNNDDAVRDDINVNIGKETSTKNKNFANGSGTKDST